MKSKYAHIYHMKDFKHGNINLRTISRPSITISTKIEQEAQDSTKTYHSIKSKVQEGEKVLGKIMKCLHTRMPGKAHKVTPLSRG